MGKKCFHVGCGAGFSGDRADGAPLVVETLVADGQPAALIFETLAERTLALAHLNKRKDPSGGYEPRLVHFLSPVLGHCVQNGIPILGNFGAANPRGAAERILQLACELGISTMRVGVVEGDDLLAEMSSAEVLAWQIDAPLACPAGDVVSANAYLGAEPITNALEGGAHVVVTGRVADPSLALAPLAKHFGWDWDDWDRLATGTLAGHLLECATQVTGGYFADPGYKDVSGPAWIGFPITELDSDGELVVTKAAKTGGLVSRATVIEQILYEVHDPSAYLTPDVTLDVTQVEVDEVNPNRVRVRGARGKARPDRIKATIGIDDGWLGEGAISYAGPNAVARARLAGSILRERMKKAFPDCRMRIDIIGVSSLFNDDAGCTLDLSEGTAPDVRMRMAVQSRDRRVVEFAVQEVISLYTCGPAGGGGVRTAVNPRLSTVSALVPRASITPRVSFVEIDHA
jgi:hypothetical protein